MMPLMAYNLTGTSTVEAEYKGQVSSITCGLPATNLFQILTYHTMYCPVSMCRFCHLGGGRAFLSYVRAVYQMIANLMTDK